jgi:hypothetical protein
VHPWNALAIEVNVVAFPILDNKVGGIYFKLLQNANIPDIVVTSGKLMFGAFCKLTQPRKLGAPPVLALVLGKITLRKLNIPVKFAIACNPPTWSMVTCSVNALGYKALFAIANTVIALVQANAISNH